MDFGGGRKLDFKEVDRRYTQLKQLHKAGNITDQEFDDKLKRLMIKDQRGRWWRKSPTTGDWHYYNGSIWIKDIPPGVNPTPQATPSTEAESQQQETQRRAEEAEQKREAAAQVAEEAERRGEEEQQQRAQQAEAPKTTVPKGTKRSSLVLLLLGLVVVAVLTIAVELIVSSRNPSPPAADSGKNLSPPPAAASSIILKDDFSDTSSGWPRGKDEYGGSGDYDTSKGIYHITPASGKAHYSTIEKGANIKDAQVEVDATRTVATPRTANWGVVCRRSSSASNKNNLYYLGIQNDGVPVIEKVHDGEPSLISDENTSAKVNDPSATNHIRGDCVGDKLTLYVNDQKLAEASDNEFASGQVGLYAGNRTGESGTDVSFDNFSVGKP